MTSPTYQSVSRTNPPDEDKDEGERAPSINEGSKKNVVLELPVRSARTDVETAAARDSSQAGSVTPSSPSGRSQTGTARERKLTSEMVDRQWVSYAASCGLSTPSSPQTNPTSPRSYSFPSAKLESTKYDELAREGGFRRHFLQVKADAIGMDPSARPKCWDEPLTVYNWNDATPFAKFGGLTTHESFAYQNSMFETAVSIFKAMVCSAIMLTPAATAKGGYIFVCICYPIFGLLCLAGIYLIIQCLGLFAYHVSFADLCYYAYGTWGSRLLNFSIAMSQTCFCAMYLIFVAENVPLIMGLTYGSLYFQSIEILALIISTVLFIPITWIRDIHHFSAINEIGSAGILFAVFVMLGGSIKVLMDNGVHHDVMKFEPNTWPRFLGVACYTFEGLAALIPIYQGMGPMDKLYWMPLFSGVLLLILALLMSVGVLGYLAFGPDVRPIAIESLPNSWLKTTSQFVYLSALLCSLPLQFFPIPLTLETSQKTFCELTTADRLSAYVSFHPVMTEDSSASFASGRYGRDKSPRLLSLEDRLNPAGHSSGDGAHVARGSSAQLSSVGPVGPSIAGGSSAIDHIKDVVTKGSMSSHPREPHSASRKISDVGGAVRSISAEPTAVESADLEQRLEAMRRIREPDEWRAEMTTNTESSRDGDPTPMWTSKSGATMMMRPVYECCSDNCDYRIKRTIYVIFITTIAFLSRHIFVTFVSLVGAVLCVPIMIIFPALIHLRLVAKSTTWVILDILLAIIGFSLTIFAVTISILEMCDENTAA